MYCLMRREGLDWESHKLSKKKKMEEINKSHDAAAAAKNLFSLIQLKAQGQLTRKQNTQNHE